MTIGEGMRAGDMEQCAGCGKGLAHTGVPLFWRVKVEVMGFDRQAIQRVHGMEQFFGGTPGPAVAIARVFEDPVIAKPLDGGTTMMLCQDCAIAEQCLPFLVEQVQAKRPKRAGSDKDEYPLRESSVPGGG